MKKLIILASILSVAGSVWAEPYIGEEPNNWATSSKVTATASNTAFGPAYGPAGLTNGGVFTVTSNPPRVLMVYTIPPTPLIRHG